MKNKLATLVGALALSAAASAQTWIWYPGAIARRICPALCTRFF